MRFYIMRGRPKKRKQTNELLSYIEWNYYYRIMCFKQINLGSMHLLLRWEHIVSRVVQILGLCVPNR